MMGTILQYLVRIQKQSLKNLMILLNDSIGTLENLECFIEVKNEKSDYNGNRDE